MKLMQRMLRGEDKVLAEGHPVITSARNLRTGEVSIPFIDPKTGRGFYVAIPQAELGGLIKTLQGEQP